jgi:hypothetical protein
MASKPLCRMGPLPRSFAGDAHDCIMVPVLMDRPNTRLYRDSADDSELPLGFRRAARGPPLNVKERNVSK